MGYENRLSIFMFVVGILVVALTTLVCWVVSSNGYPPWSIVIGWATAAGTGIGAIALINNRGKSAFRAKLVTQLKALILATYGEAERGSIARRWFTRLSVLLVVRALADYLLEDFAQEDRSVVDQVFTVFLQFWGVFYFVSNVLVPMFLGVWFTRFTVQPVRLVLDILLSGAVAICAAALFFRGAAIIDPAFSTEEVAAHAGPEAVLYFVVVTFSTLGYGDLQPPPEARLWAGLLAIYGNIHLGLLAGAVFYAIQSTQHASMPPDKHRGI